MNHGKLWQLWISMGKKNSLEHLRLHHAHLWCLANEAIEKSKNQRLKNEKSSYSHTANDRTQNRLLSVSSIQKHKILKGRKSKAWMRKLDKWFKIKKNEKKKIEEH